MTRYWMAAAAVVLIAQPANAGKQVEERHKVSDTVTVEVEDVIGGRIEILGWDQSEVEVTGEIGDDVERLEVEVHASRVTIRPIVPQVGGKNVDVDVALTIRVPKTASRVETGTVSAHTHVSNVAGRLEVETVSGEIRITGDAAEAELSTVSGSVVSAGSRKELDVESVSGDVSVTGDADEVSVESVSGGIEYRGRPGSLEVQTVSGNLRVFLPGDIRAGFDISTFSGKITSAFGGKPEKHGVGGGHSLEHSTGTKGRIEVESVSGSVTIEKM